MTATGPRPSIVLVTRPEHPGQVLAAQLRAQGCDALWWPAFDLLPAADPAALAASIDDLERFDVVIFVSPAAVQAFGGALNRQWPAGTAIAVMGAATQAAVLGALRGSTQARILGPVGAGAGEGGSEQLWPVLASLVPAPRRVLLVRAQSGRQWIVERLRGEGVEVTDVAAYRRVASEPAADQWAALHAARLAQLRLAVLYTSTESVPVLARQLGRVPALAQWFAGSIGLCIHERIARALHDAGCTDVRRCNADAASIRVALQQERGTDRGAAAYDAGSPMPPPAPRIS